jgi:hypothetical protein
VEDVAAVDRIHGGVQVGVAGQQHAHGFGSFLADAGEEFGAAHAGHAHIRDDDGEGTVAVQRHKAFAAAGGGGDLEVAMKDSPEAVKGGGFVAHKKDFVAHKHLRELSQGSHAASEETDPGGAWQCAWANAAGRDVQFPHMARGTLLCASAKAARPRGRCR